MVEKEPTGKRQTGTPSPVQKGEVQGRAAVLEGDWATGELIGLSPKEEKVRELLKATWHSACPKTPGTTHTSPQVVG